MAVSLDLTKLGSPSALSLFASADTIPAMIAAGAVLAVNAALFSYSEYKSYQEKIHKEKMKDVNDLYLAHLKQIIVPHHGKIHGFPPIFQLVDGIYQSMHFTPAQVKGIGTEVPHGTDISLSSYRESVRAAIRKLKEYYFSRKKGNSIKENDITAGVLSYLMQMLDTKCLNFLGYDYDIAYLDAICKFINAYSSRNGVNSQHFSRLAPVYAHLLKAKQKLEKHKEVLSLEETVAELKDSCVNHSDILIRMLVKMVIKDSDTDLADTVAQEELKEGILRQHYIHSEILGFEIRSDDKILIPESIFKDWIKKLSDYYLRAQNTDLGQQDNNLHSPNDFFAFLNKAKEILGRKLFGHHKEQEKMHAQLKLIRKVFQESGNFISTRYNKHSKKFEIITDSLHLVDRSLIMAKVAKLAHEIISLQYLCMHLLKSIQLLGDLYVNNPAHFCKIFDVLDRLCILIQDDVRSTKKAFRQLQEDNDNNMQIEEKELFPNQVKDALESIYGEIKDLGEQVKECRQAAIKSIKVYTEKSVHYEMLAIAKAISNMYFDASNDPILNHGNTNTPNTTPDETINIPEEQSPQVEEQDNFIENMNTFTQELRDRILEIQKTELFQSNNYFKIYDALVILKNKTIELLKENTKDPVRIDKANNMLQLTSALLNETLKFLNQPTAERQVGATRFFNKIHSQLNDESNISFIDRHHNQASGFIYKYVCSQGIFRTDTRRKLAQFEEACLTASYN